MRACLSSRCSRVASRDATKAIAPAVAAARTQQQQQRLAVAAAATQQQQEQQPTASRPSPLRQALAAAALSATLLLGGCGGQAIAASQSALADTVRDQYPAITGDPVDRAALDQFQSKLYLEWLEAGHQSGPDFVVRLFDLNADGQLSAEEVLRSLAIIGSVADGRDSVSPRVFAAFDADKSGTISASEWSNALGDLGPDGDGAKRYFFNRVDTLGGADGALDGAEFFNALSLARDVILGGGPSDGLVSYERGF